MMGPWTILGNHLFGGTIFLYDGAPDFPAPMRLWEMIERHRITTFGISPTAIRLLSKSAGRPARDGLTADLGSTGEPWDETAWLWYFEHVGRRRCPIINISRRHRNRRQLACSRCRSKPLKPCTLGGPAPGMATEVVDENGVPVRGRKGYLVCTKPAPSMTRGIWNDPGALYRNLLVALPRHVVSRRLGQRRRRRPLVRLRPRGRIDERGGPQSGPAEVEDAMMQNAGGGGSRGDRRAG